MDVTLFAYLAGLSVPGSWHPQILAVQLTLSQTGEQIMPTTSLLLAPTDFWTLLRPCSMPSAFYSCWHALTHFSDNWISMSTVLLRSSTTDRAYVRPTYLLTTKAELECSFEFFYSTIANNICGFLFNFSKWTYVALFAQQGFERKVFATL